MISEKQKKKAVEHIGYEIMMFNGTHMKLLSGIQDPFEVNVLLESFVIHSRCLFGFFYSIKKHPDDITVDDYIVRMTEFRSRRTRKRILENLTNKANKQIAHLTYSRNNYNKRTKGWSIPTITQNMNKTIIAFLECLNPEQREWFKDLYRQYNVNRGGFKTIVMGG